MNRKSNIKSNKKQKLLKEIYKTGIKLLKQDKYDWDLLARENQKIPKNDWKIWMIMAGRGFGKTRTGAESIKKLVQQGYKNICLLGKNKEDVRRIMIDGKSGIMNIYPKNQRPKFIPSQNILKWSNGAVAQIHSSDSYESLRGPQFDLAWVDELAKFSNLDKTWDQLMMTMRLGNPKIIVTTTPKPLPIFHKIISQKHTYCTVGNTMDNADNLSKEYIEYIKEEYGNTDFGKQEIYGKLLDEVKLWSNNIKYHDVKHSNLSKIIISIDPAVTNNSNSDETGIIVLGKKEKEIFVLEDKSGKYNIIDLPIICNQLMKKYKTNCIIAEVNQGGDMVEQVIKMDNPGISFHGIRSIKDKFTRAQSAACLYDYGRIFHTNNFTELENQMKCFPNQSKSPDRVDALAMGIEFLRNCKSDISIMFI